MTIGVAQEALSLDGKRKGFIIGIGIGPGLTSFSQSLKFGGSRVTSDRLNKMSFMSDFKIGYAPAIFCKFIGRAKFLGSA